MIDLLLLPALAMLLLSVLSGPLGCFLVWQRMAYFGDTVAHASLVGIGVGIFMNWGPLPGVVLSSVAVALLIASQRVKNTTVATDARLGIVAHASLALGLLLLSALASKRVDLYAVLTGELLTIDRSDVIILAALVVITLGILQRLWRPLILMIIDEDLARADGIKVRSLRVTLALLTALSVAVGVQLVGVLLMSALLIIPAVAARQLSSSPESMVIVASAMTGLASIGGLTVSALEDLPAGPAIVCVACLFLPVSAATRRWLGKEI